MRLGWTIFWGSRPRRLGGGTFGVWLGRGDGESALVLSIGWGEMVGSVRLWELGPEKLYIIE